MEECLKGVLNDFLEEIKETPETPVASNLFNVRYDNERELLDKTRAQTFHHAVAQVIFTGIQCRKDTHMAIDLLTTKVRKPDKENWKKLRISLK